MRNVVIALCLLAATGCAAEGVVSPDTQDPGAPRAGAAPTSDASQSQPDAGYGGEAATTPACPLVQACVDQVQARYHQTYDQWMAMVPNQSCDAGLALLRSYGCAL